MIPGRDRRLETYPAHGGLPDAGLLGRRPRAAVVGGGIAGLTAATGLAERGVEVTVFERERHLGGRAGGWDERLPDGTAVTMSRGFHAFFRQYYNLRALLARTDPGLDRLTEVPDYPLVDRRGRTDTFAGLPLTPPFNALAFALRSPTFTARDLVRLNGPRALPLATVSVPRIYEQLDHVDAATFLTAINFPAAARHLAFEVFSRSFFADPGELSAAELATMFHLYFLGSAEGLLFDVPAEPFPQALWDPLAGYLTGLRAEIRTGVAVSGIRREAAGFRVGGEAYDAVVLACDVPGLQRVLAGSPDLGTPGWRATVEDLRTAPPFLVRRLWLDRPVRADRPAFLGTGGLPPLDNISVLERYEGEARRWARRHRGSVVELHAYAAGADTGRVTREMDERLHRIYPETADAGLIGEVTLVRQDCPLFPVGGFARRPTVGTPEPGLVLAGDAIRVDLPVALMERAATTGWSAANTLLRGWGLLGHPLRSVPNRGRIPLLERLVSGHGFRGNPDDGRQLRTR
ncbi:FAD-dependent oxidoreductase [Amycolatopsis sp. WQ 127309]|uniref:FAD-dependent oxidoreductase n=1 Tax=Amycolatopsis sp. WQ 127309 TaxID=2932773 RepID=UPI001FF38D07|nr:FAD-dependent oxidoreductase [Amycolatopsis sp. WQ 127309]UOZ04953.1 FAD-dependent oxidoreductase [Amycolatopsis sp. WQ 127309]